MYVVKYCNIIGQDLHQIFISARLDIITAQRSYIRAIQCVRSINLGLCSENRSRARPIFWILTDLNGLLYSN